MVKSMKTVTSGYFAEFKMKGILFELDILLAGELRSGKIPKVVFFQPTSSLFQLLELFEV